MRGFRSGRVTPRELKMIANAALDRKRERSTRRYNAAKKRAERFLPLAMWDIKRWMLRRAKRGEYEGLFFGLGYGETLLGCMVDELRREGFYAKLSCGLFGECGAIVKWGRDE